MKTVNVITRIKPDDHAKLVAIKASTGYSLNTLITHGIRMVIKYHADMVERGVKTRSSPRKKKLKG